MVQLSGASAADPTDERLLTRIGGGDRAAERLLFERHAARVFRLARRIGGDDHTAADMVQEVFVRVFDGLASFRGESQFTTWLHRVTVTTCLNARRARRRHRDEVSLEALQGESAAPRSNPLLGLAISEAIDALPQSHRLPLVMHAVEGFSHREIADALDITEGTSRRRVSEARAILRERLDRSPAGEGSA
jgi:RNA polymerase sigma-70 factor (ECF subfamily)